MMSQLLPQAVTADVQNAMVASAEVPHAMPGVNVVVHGHGSSYLCASCQGCLAAPD